MDTKWLTRNRYTMPPEAHLDEDGESVYVRVTALTRSAQEARAWLLANPQAVHLDPERERLVPDRLTCKGLDAHLTATGPLAGGELHDEFAVRSLIVSGAATAWWEFEFYSAREDLPDTDCDELFAQRQQEQEQEQQRRAREWRAPLWWRGQWRLSRTLQALGSRLDPKDRASAGWRDPAGGRYVVVEGLRRPAHEAPGAGADF